MSKKIGMEYDKLETQTVMVAGGAGFVGSAVVRELLERGIPTVSFDNYLHGVPENVEGLDGPLEIVRGDVLDPWQLIDCLNSLGVTAIIDCIGDTFVPTGYQLPQRFFDINLQGTFNLLQAVRFCGVKRILYVSSTEVYGRVSDLKAGERTPLAPVNTYAVSKLAADQLCYTFALEHNVPVIVARIFNCYGPRETEPYIIPEIISQLNKSNVLELGNIRAERDFTYVHDTARALIALLESDVSIGTAVNVGSDNCYSVEWLAKTLAELMGVSDLEIRQDPLRMRKMDIDRFQCDNTLLRNHTGWAPQVEIITGLRKTIEWYRGNGCTWSWENFVDGTTLYQPSSTSNGGAKDTRLSPILLGQ